MENAATLISECKYLCQRRSNIERRAVMNTNINYYGIVILLRKLRECGNFTEKELERIAAKIAADNGAEIIISL